MNTSLLITPLLALSSTSAVNAQIWAETGDAGPLPATAQVPVGVGPLTQIDGALTAGPGEDMYKIYIADPANFSATTEPTGVGTLFDTQLFLFDANGNGITHNDDTPTAPGLRSTLTSQFIPPTPGHYYIAVSPYNNDPLSGTNLIWNNFPFNVERQPDGPGAAGVVDGWDRNFGPSGTYTILLTGCEFPNQDPDCSNAAPSLGRLWPPNHQFVGINVLGVTDPDNDPITITIDSIFQDEVVAGNGQGAGNTLPDGAGVGTDTAAVRAERNGNRKTPGNGRVYTIRFTASDGRGGTCSGVVRVCVPHSVKSACVDDGELYDSTIG